MAVIERQERAEYLCAPRRVHWTLVALAEAAALESHLVTARSPSQ